MDNGWRIVVLKLIVEMLEALDYPCITLVLHIPGRVVSSHLSDAHHLSISQWLPGRHIHP
jgi:hypothetical protein